MSLQPEDWGWWSETKLKVLADYLKAFTNAVRGRSSGANYLDLFAGSYVNNRRNSTGTFPGSSQIALTVDPQFTRLAFFELSEPAKRLTRDISDAIGNDGRWQVFEGDCNNTLPKALLWLNDYRWAPTFAFLDPRGFQLDWRTVEHLADWRRDKKTKIEQCILFPTSSLLRVLGHQDKHPESSTATLDRLFGCRDWIMIYQLRKNDTLTAEQARTEYVNLYRWQLENSLQYRTTHALQIIDTDSRPLYTLIFATDSKPGNDIMSHLYNSAHTSMIPTMQARANAVKRQQQEFAQGVTSLPFPDSHAIKTANTAPDNYEHTPPWQPPALSAEEPQTSQVDDFNLEDGLF